MAGLIRARGAGAGAGRWHLRLPPAPGGLAALPYYGYHPFGVERRRAEVDPTGRRPAPPGSRRPWTCRWSEAYARLTALPGLGPWTAAEVGVRALGEPTR